MDEYKEFLEWSKDSRKKRKEVPRAPPSPPISRLLEFNDERLTHTSFLELLKFYQDELRVNRDRNYAQLRREQEQILTDPSIFLVDPVALTLTLNPRVANLMSVSDPDQVPEGLADILGIIQQYQMGVCFRDEYVWRFTRSWDETIFNLDFPDLAVPYPTPPFDLNTRKGKRQLADWNGFVEEDGAIYLRPLVAFRVTRGPKHRRGIKFYVTAKLYTATCPSRLAPEILATGQAPSDYLFDTIYALSSVTVEANTHMDETQIDIDQAIDDHKSICADDEEWARETGTDPNYPAIDDNDVRPVKVVGTHPSREEVYLLRYALTAVLNQVRDFADSEPPAPPRQHTPGGHHRIRAWPLYMHPENVPLMDNVPDHEIDEDEGIFDGSIDLRVDHTGSLIDMPVAEQLAFFLGRDESMTGLPRQVIPNGLPLRELRE